MIETGTTLSVSARVPDCADASMIEAGTGAAPGVASETETGVETGGVNAIAIVIVHATGAESTSSTGNASVTASENAIGKGQESGSAKGSVSGTETGTAIATEIGTEGET